ncbi:MAG TPA: hypothetical protein VF158_02820, partial [Longimicrobiales bacterium]
PPPPPPPPVDTTAPAPPPSPPVAVTLTLTDTVLRARPRTPYYVFVTARVDSAGQRVADSLALTMSPTTLARLWWNAQARRWELYDAVASGTITLIGRRGAVADTARLRVETGAPPTPPSAPDSIAAIHVLTERDSLPTGTTMTICGVYVTRAGVTGLLAFDAAAIGGDTTVVRVGPAGPDDDRCALLATARGFVLTPGAPVRPAQWTVERRP